MSQSRMESILSGNYTGRPLSRVEALLMAGGGSSSGSGSGSGTISPTTQDFDDTDVNDIMSYLSTEND